MGQARRREGSDQVSSGQGGVRWGVCIGGKVGLLVFWELCWARGQDAKGHLSCHAGLGKTRALDSACLLQRRNCFQDGGVLPVGRGSGASTAPQKHSPSSPRATASSPQVPRGLLEESSVKIRSLPSPWLSQPPPRDELSWVCSPPSIHLLQSGRVRFILRILSSRHVCEAPCGGGGGVGQELGEAALGDTPLPSPRGFLSFNATFQFHHLLSPSETFLPKSIP